MNTTPHDLASWIAFLTEVEIPLLKHTSRDIEKLKAREENASARAIAHAVNQDPMMIFRVLRYMQTHKKRSQQYDLVLVEQAIIMMGTEAFFRDMPLQPIVEDTMRKNLNALSHILRLVHRSHRAGHFAYEWALLLRDLHAEEVRVAAMLHDLTEILMWCFAPVKMEQIFNMQNADKTLRSCTAQEQIFGFRLLDLQIGLAEACNLPPLLLALMKDHKTASWRIRNVNVAVNFARHSAHGWEDAALPDDFKDIAELLRVNVDKAKQIVGAPSFI